MKSKKILKVLPLVLASGIALVGCNDHTDTHSNQGGSSQVESLEKQIETKIKEINNIQLTGTTGKTSKSIKSANKKLDELKKVAIEQIKASKTIDEVKSVKLDVKEAEKLLENISFETNTVNLLTYLTKDNEVKNLYVKVNDKGVATEIYSYDHEDPSRRIVFGYALPTELKTMDGEVLPNNLFVEIKDIYSTNLSNSKENKIKELEEVFNKLDMVDKTHASKEAVELIKANLIKDIESKTILNDLLEIKIPSVDELQQKLIEIAFVANSTNVITSPTSYVKYYVITNEENNVTEVLYASGSKVLMMDTSKGLIWEDDALPLSVVNEILSVVSEQKAADDLAKLNSAKDAKIKEINAVSIENQELYTKDSLSAVGAKLEQDKNTQIALVNNAKTIKDVEDVKLPLVNKDGLETLEQYATRLEKAKNDKIAQINAVSIENNELYTEESFNAAQEKLAKEKEDLINKVKAFKTVDEVENVKVPVVDSSLLEKIADVKAAKEQAKEELTKLDNYEKFKDVEDVKSALSEAQTAIDESKSLKDVESAKKEGITKLTAALEKAEKDLNTAKDTKIKSISDITIENPKLYTEESLKKANAKLDDEKAKQIKLVNEANSIKDVEDVKLPIEYKDLLETLEQYNVRLDEAKKSKTEKIEAVKFDVNNKDEYTENSLKEAQDKFNSDKAAKLEDVKKAKTVEGVEGVELPKVDTSLLKTKEEEAAEKLEAAKEAKRTEIKSIVLDAKTTEDKTQDSINKANEKLKELKDAALKQIEDAKTEEDVNKVNVDLKSATDLLKDSEPAKDETTEEDKNKETEEDKKDDVTPAEPEKPADEKDNASESEDSK